MELPSRARNEGAQEWKIRSKLEIWKEGGGIALHALSALIAIFALALAIALPTAATASEGYPLSYPEDKPYYEFSVYGYHHNTSTDPNEIYPMGVFRLIDDSQNVVYAYCADNDLFDIPGTNYKVVPLDKLDTTSRCSGNLRAIIKNSYPFITAQEMINKVKESGNILHEDVVPNYEMVLISAVQQAIIKNTNLDWFNGIGDNYY